MLTTIPKDKLPLIGFFPLFYNFAESGRAIVIAKRYLDIGGKAVFFSHGGEYEYLAKDIGCKVIRVNPIYTKEYIDWLWASSRFESFRNPFTLKILDEHIREEVAAYKKSEVRLIISTNNFPCYISTKVAKIPFVSITTKLFLKFTKYPEDAEILFTRFVPDFIKRTIINWYYPLSKGYVRTFRKISKKYGVKPPRYSWNITSGDYSLLVDFKEFLGVTDSILEPNETFVGISFFDELLSKYYSKTSKKEDEIDVIKHIKQPGRSILLSLGSSGNKKILFNILNTLNKTKYNVVVVYTSILKEEEIPKYNKNIIFKKFVPSIEKINKTVDLAILSGGKGTVYTAAYSGKPVIGFPMQFEQHLNLEGLVKHGTGKILSRKNFRGKVLLTEIKEIFDNYDNYVKKCKKLKDSLPQPDGDQITFNKILEIMKKENLIK